MSPAQQKTLLKQGSLLLAQDRYNEIVFAEYNCEPCLQICVSVQMEDH